MSAESFDDVQTEFSDLLEGNNDPELARLVARLSRQYTAADPARWLAGPPRVQREAAGAHPPSRARAFRRSRLSLSVAGVVLALLIVSIGVVLATGNILDLGKPTDTQSTNAYFPLGGFHRVRAQPAAQLPAGILYFYAPVTDESNAEEWPLVKALEQFGTLSGVKAAPPACFQYPLGRTKTLEQICHTPGFVFTHASFKSRYISVGFRPLVDAKGRCLTGRLSTADWATFVTYAHSKSHDRYLICRQWSVALNPVGMESGDPWLFVGSYLQPGIQLVHPGDFTELIPQTPTASSPDPQPPVLPFATIQRDLATATNPPTSSLVQDVNAEANVITALICHADGGRPGSVCGRPVIKLMLRHVK